MEYFKIVLDKPYSNYPKMKNWYGIIDTQKLWYGNAHHMPQRQLLFIEPNNELVFTDVIIKPFFVVSETVRDTIKMYDSTIPFHDLVLLEKKSAKLQVYQIPFFQKSICKKKDGDQLNQIFEFDEDDDFLQRRAVIKFEYMNETYILMRLDLVESLLRRKMTGFSIEPVIIRGK